MCIGFTVAYAELVSNLQGRRSLSSSLYGVIGLALVSLGLVMLLTHQQVGPSSLEQKKQAQQA